MIGRGAIEKALKAKGLRIKTTTTDIHFTRPAGKVHNSYRIIPTVKGQWELQRDFGKFQTDKKDSYLPCWETVGDSIQSVDELLLRISRRVYGGTPPWKK